MKFKDFYTEGVRLGGGYKPSPHDAEGNRIAKELGIKYIGWWEDGKFFTFNDPESDNTTFVAKDFEQAEDKLENVRKTFKSKLESNLNEMPHIYDRGVAIDYELEKPGWVDKMIANLEEYGEDTVLKPFYKMKFKLLLQKQFKRLSRNEKNKLLDELPIKFIQDMRIG